MADEYPDMFPLERILDAQDVALRAARRLRADIYLAGSSLSFRPGIMRRVADEAPILTDIPRLKALNIRTPEEPIQMGPWSKPDWMLRVDLSWISYTEISGLWSWFGEQTRYMAGTLEELTDPTVKWDPLPMFVPLYVETA